MITFIIIILILILSQVFEFNKINNRYASYTTIICFLLLTINISYTADWHNYEKIFYDTEIETKDFFIKFISSQLRELGFNYNAVYQFHIIWIAILYTYFTRKFLRNPLILVLCFLLMTYVPLTNQIRYFLAFSLYLLSIHSFYYKKYNSFIFFAFLALINHIGILPLYLILLFIRKTIKRKYYAVLAVIIYVIIYAFMNISYVSQLGGFNIYLIEEMKSSFLGGLLKTLPSVITLTFIFILARKKKNKSENEVFLYNVSFFPIMFIPASTVLQILGDRYVFIFSIIWLIYLSIILKSRIKSNLMWKLIIILYALTMWCIFYLLPIVFFDYSHLYNEFLMTFKSQFNG